MRVFIRVDASVELGTGHVMRCLTLADMLRLSGMRSDFISQTMPSSLYQLIREKEFAIHILPQRHSNDGVGRDEPFNCDLDAKATIQVIRDQGEESCCLIIDHYQIMQQWHQQVSPFVSKICVIDDLANRIHDCDVLLDANFHIHPELRYKHLVSSNCLQLLGPSYALLRREFTEAAKLAKPRCTFHRVLITFGGSDPTGETLKVLDAIAGGELSGFQFDFVVGGSHPNKAEIFQKCAQFPNVHYHYNVMNMEKLMLEADISVGSGGISLWERCKVALPSILIVVADNQQATTDALDHVGIVKSLGWHQQVTPDDIVTALHEVDINIESWKRRSIYSYELMADCIRDNANGPHPLVQAIIQFEQEMGRHDDGHSYS